MASVEVMTACENVCRDFSWLPDMLNDLAPLIALVGAILLFFLQRRSDRQGIEKANRLKLYSDYLGGLEKHFDHYRRFGKREHEDGFSDLFTLAAQVEILGPKAVSEQCNTATSAFLTLHSADEHRQKAFSSDGRERFNIDHFFFERRKLLNEMKAAIGE